MGLLNKLKLIQKNEQVAELNNGSLLNDYRNYCKTYSNGDYEIAWDYLRMFRAELMNAYGLANYCERNNIPCYINTMDLTTTLRSIDRTLLDKEYYPEPLDKDVLAVLSQRTIEATREVFKPGIYRVRADMESYISSFPEYQDYMGQIPLVVYVPCHLPNSMYGIEKETEHEVKTSDMLTTENGYRHLKGNIYKKDGDRGLVINMDSEPAEPKNKISVEPDFDM